MKNKNKVNKKQDKGNLYPIRPGVEFIKDDNKDEVETETEEDCPFCSTVRDVLEDIMDSDDYDEQFGILHSVINQVREIGYHEGYVSSLRNQANTLEKIADDLDDDFYDEGNGNLN